MSDIISCSQETSRQNNDVSSPWAWASWTAQDTTITSDMHRGYVVPDGWDEVHFNRGATITVNADAPTLTLLTFRTTMEEKLAATLDH